MKNAADKTDEQFMEEWLRVYKMMDKHNSGEKLLSKAEAEEFLADFEDRYFIFRSLGAYPEQLQPYKDNIAILTTYLKEKFNV